jgi:para-nitrobenzyl esterase
VFSSFVSKEKMHRSALGKQSGRAHRSFRNARPAKSEPRVEKSRPQVQDLRISAKRGPKNQRKSHYSVASDAKIGFSRSLNLKASAMKPAQLVPVLLLALFGLSACSDGTTVQTQNGEVRGVLQGQVVSFKALPYAAPPTGKLRWMPPLEPGNWTGIREASKFSEECPQTDTDATGHQAFGGDEDCLYLNVFKPSGAHALPVIVFIHGGSNVSGSAGLTSPNKVAVYDGSRLAQNENVVVVTLNYRLGTLGFIAHPKLSATSGYKASGNYAYMDQIQALKWVQRNIAAFGGDPGNVTLWGHSAGAKSIWVHLASPLTEGLFHRAIIHSGVKEGAKEVAFAEQMGLTLSQHLNCSNAADELACMRGKSAEEVVAAMPSGRRTGDYVAVVDGKVLKESPIEVMRRGQHHHVPVLEGNVKDEMSILGLNASKDIHSEEDYVKAVKALAGDSAPDMLRLYPAGNYPSPRQAFIAMIADEDYLCSSRRVLKALSASQDEFVGRFFYTHTFSGGQYAQFGASHGFELFSIFGTLSAAEDSPTADELALVKTFQDTWAGFARTGAAPPFWKRYDAQADNYVVFDTAMSDGDHLRNNQCDEWDTLGD